MREWWYWYLWWMIIDPLAMVHALACNGHPDLCSRTFDNVTYLVTHDAYAVGLNLGATQGLPILSQLDAGVRGLKLSPIMSPNRTIHLCHTACDILDAGPAKDTLNEIGAWLESHPNEVVTIMWNNLYSIDITSLSSVYDDRVKPFIYTPKGNTWPTLQDMIASGKRLVNFVDAQANTAVVPWLIDQFSVVFETPYQNVDKDAFNCNVDRPKGLSSPQGMMYVLNHFLYGELHLGTLTIDVPMRTTADFINGPSLWNHSMNCTQKFGKAPSFIEVDFFDKGNTLYSVNRLNGVTFPSTHDQPDTLLSLVSSIVNSFTSHAGRCRIWYLGIIISNGLALLSIMR